jgi:DNA-binding XRE family transcriptional regulator
MTAKTFAEWRIRLGWTKAKAAEELGCSKNSIMAWESGKSAIPRYIALACKALLIGEPPLK